RTLALATLLLILFDPSLPATGGTGATTAVALDASLSMQLPVSPTDSTSRWNAAVPAARRATGGGNVLVFGDGVRSVAASDLDRVRPDAGHSRLLPALRAAAEGGARRLVVVSDGGIEDAGDVARWAARYGIAVEFSRIGDAQPAARSLTELDAPSWVEAGEPVTVSVAVGAGAQRRGRGGDGRRSRHACRGGTQRLRTRRGGTRGRHTDLAAAGPGAALPGARARDFARPAGARLSARGRRRLDPPGPWHGRRPAGAGGGGAARGCQRRAACAARCRGGNPGLAALRCRSRGPAPRLRHRRRRSRHPCAAGRCGQRRVLHRGRHPVVAGGPLAVRAVSRRPPASDRVAQRR